jgi:predicted RNA-binding Zn ribbon-like protein
VVTRSPTVLDFIGGHPALDLANTLGGARGAEPDEDYLGDYDDVIVWATRAHVIDETDGERLAATARRRPDDADRAFARTRELRSAVVSVFGAIAESDEPAPLALDDLLALHAEALARGRLEPDGDAFELAWDGDDLERVIWPLALSAVDLLREGPLSRVKSCADCCWMFLDLSRNRSRRWCSMNHCGGRRKMQRYRARRRATEGR